MFVRAAAVNRELTAKELAAAIREERKARKQLLRQNATEEGRKALALNYQAFPPPFRQYIYFCGLCDKLTKSTFYGNYILACILIAGALVGVSTFPGMDTNPTMIVLDQIILYSFASEVILKTISEGFYPYRYFICSEWSWNWFDFLIVLFSMPFIPFAAGQVKLLRLVRLMRLAKVFRRVPRLQMIIMGLVGGLKSIAYIVLLMVLVFYMYAIIGVMFFKAKDAVHFKSIEISMLTLLRIATLDGWGDLMYLNIFGCDVYNEGDYTTNPYQASIVLGGVMWCQDYGGQPGLTVAYFVSFIFIATFCILSLFVGAVSLSMAESMIAMRRERESKKAQIERDHMKVVVEVYRDTSKLNRRQLRKMKLLEKAFRGQDMAEEVISADANTIAGMYQWLSYRCQDLAESNYFKNFVTLIILLAGVSVGIDTDPVMSAKLSWILEDLGQLIQSVFLFECWVNITAEEFRPWRYFIDNWNKFDFFVVMISYVPTGSGSSVTILRLLRLLRVLKLMKAIPQLQVIVGALLSTLTSIGYISVLIFLFFYFWGIVGMTFFGDNDPWHFGNLPMAMITQLEVATFDGWSGNMYQNMYGSAQNPANTPLSVSLPVSQPQFILASLYFVVACVVEGFVLMTLFIGVVGMGMEESQQEQKVQAAIDKKAARIAEVENLSKTEVALYREIFDIINVTDSARIGREEMKFGFQLAKIILSDEDFEELWRRVDRDGSGNIDFSEFLEFMFDLRAQQKENERIEAGGAASTGQVRRQFKMMGRQKFENLDVMSTGGSVQDDAESVASYEGVDLKDRLPPFNPIAARKSSISELPLIERQPEDHSNSNSGLLDNQISDIRKIVQESSKVAPKADILENRTSFSPSGKEQLWKLAKASSNANNVSSPGDIQSPNNAGVLQGQLPPLQSQQQQQWIAAHNAYQMSPAPAVLPAGMPGALPVSYGFVPGYPYPVPVQVPLAAGRPSVIMGMSPGHLTANNKSHSFSGGETTPLFGIEGNHNSTDDDQDLSMPAMYPYPQPVSYFPSAFQMPHLAYFNPFAQPKVHPYSPQDNNAGLEMSQQNQQQDQQQQEQRLQQGAFAPWAGGVPMQPVGQFPYSMVQMPYFGGYGVPGSPSGFVTSPFEHGGDSISGHDEEDSSVRSKSRVRRKPVKSKVMSI